jgi:hypothetical protein
MGRAIALIVAAAGQPEQEPIAVLTVSPNSFRSNGSCDGTVGLLRWFRSSPKLRPSIPARHASLASATAWVPQANTKRRYYHQTVSGHFRVKLGELQVGKGGGHSPPSPLSHGGQFPRFTGVPLSGTGRPHDACPLRGGSLSPPPVQFATRSTNTAPSVGTALAWPLRPRTLPAEAGCMASLTGDSGKSFRTETAPHG